MKIKRLTMFLSPALAALLLCACTTQAWYEGFRQGAENECRKQPPGAAEDCLSRTNKQSYDEYARERSTK